MVPELPPDVASHRQWLLSLVPKPEIGIWIDPGCGSGADALFVADRLAGTACRVVELDSSARSIEAAMAAAGGNDRMHFRHESLMDAAAIRHGLRTRHIVPLLAMRRTEHGSGLGGGGGSRSAHVPGSASFGACACGMTSGPTSTRRSSRSGAR